MNSALYANKAGYSSNGKIVPVEHFCHWQLSRHYYYVYMSSDGLQKWDSLFWHHCTVRFTCLKIIHVWQTRRWTCTVQASEQRVVWSWKACTLITDFTNFAIAVQPMFMPLMTLVLWIMDHAAHCKIQPKQTGTDVYSMRWCHMCKVTDIQIHTVFLSTMLKNILEIAA